MQSVLIKENNNAKNKMSRLSITSSIREFLFLSKKILILKHKTAETYQHNVKNNCAIKF